MLDKSFKQYTVTLKHYRGTEFCGAEQVTLRHGVDPGLWVGSVNGVYKHLYNSGLEDKLTSLELYASVGV